MKNWLKRNEDLIVLTIVNTLLISAMFVSKFLQMELSKKEQELVDRLFNKYGSESVDIVFLMLEYQFDIYGHAYNSLKRVKSELKSLILEKIEEKR